MYWFPAKQKWIIVQHRNINSVISWFYEIWLIINKDKSLTVGSTINWIKVLFFTYASAIKLLVVCINHNIHWDYHAESLLEVLSNVLNSEKGYKADSQCVQHSKLQTEQQRIVDCGSAVHIHLWQSCSYENVPERLITDWLTDLFTQFKEQDWTIRDKFLH